ncbi:MAG: metallophosphoesterase [Victivallaceae bacterium]|nr:metallophosphoesterase [Victivallaceae bacterium]
MKKKLKYLAVSIIGLCFVLELIVITVIKTDDTSVPANLGNFPKNIQALTAKKAGDSIRFAVIGDSRSEGTMELLADQIRDMPIDFGVLLGDISFKGLPQEHRWLRNEINTEWKLSFPLFYIVGNHDISKKKYPVATFEKNYGPTVFSFEYGKCLFIFLRVWNVRGNDYEESLKFLKELNKQPLDKYHKRIVFMHQPPPIPTLSPVTEFTNTDEFNKLFEKMKIDYVFACDFHGYAWTRYNGTIYNITGGGGAGLVKTTPPQFYHLLVFEIGKNYVSKQIVVTPNGFNVGDHLHRFATVGLAPLFQQYPLQISVMNIILLIIGVLLIIILKKAKRIEDE